MKIFLAADHRGFRLKKELAVWLATEGHEVVDLGAAEETPDDDYPTYGFAVANAVAKENNTRGIAVCGSGVGIAVAANKVAGIRAALIHDPAVVAAARNDDDINVLALGADFITLEAAKAVITPFLTTAFSGEDRHVRRLKEIADVD